MNAQTDFLHRASYYGQSREFSEAFILEITREAKEITPVEFFSNVKTNDPLRAEVAAYPMQFRFFRNGAWYFYRVNLGGEKTYYFYR